MLSSNSKLVTLILRYSVKNSKGLKYIESNDITNYINEQDIYVSYDIVIYSKVQNNSINFECYPPIQKLILSCYT